MEDNISLVDYRKYHNHDNHAYHLLYIHILIILNTYVINEF